MESSTLHSRWVPLVLQTGGDCLALGRKVMNLTPVLATSDSNAGELWEGLVPLCIRCRWFSSESLLHTLLQPIMQSIIRHARPFPILRTVHWTSDFLLLRLLLTTFAKVLELEEWRWALYSFLVGLGVGRGSWLNVLGGTKWPSSCWKGWLVSSNSTLVTLVFV